MCIPTGWLPTAHSSEYISPENSWPSPSCVRLHHTEKLSKHCHLKLPLMQHILSILLELEEDKIMPIPPPPALLPHNSCKHRNHLSSRHVLTIHQDIAWNNKGLHLQNDIRWKFFSLWSFHCYEQQDACRRAHKRHCSLTKPYMNFSHKNTEFFQNLTSKIQTCKVVCKSCACNLDSSQLDVCTLDKA